MTTPAPHDNINLPDTVKKITTIATGERPTKIAINPVSKQVFVVNSGSNNVTVIDENDTATTINVQANPTEIVVNTSTGNTFVMNSGSNSITAIYVNGSTENIPTWTSSADKMAVNAVTNKLYVAHFNQSCITEIDLSNNYINTIPADYPSFIAIAIDSKSNKIYAANMNTDANNVTIIDDNNNTITTVATGTYPSSIVINTVTNTVYIGNLNSHNTTVIDGETNTVISTIGSSGTVTALNTATNEIYGFTQSMRVPSPPKDIFCVIDCTNNTAQEIFPLPAISDSISAIAINALTNKIYVVHSDTSEVLVYDGKNIQATPTSIPVGAYPTSIAIDADAKKIYVANWNSNSVTIIEEN